MIHGSAVMPEQTVTIAIEFGMKYGTAISAAPRAQRHHAASLLAVHDHAHADQTKEAGEHQVCRIHRAPILFAARMHAALLEVGEILRGLNHPAMQLWQIIVGPGVRFSVQAI